MGEGFTKPLEGGIAMRLKPGEQVRDFSAKDVNGNPISVKSLSGKKWMLSFYRYAGCPLCNFRVHELLKEYDEWQNDGFTMISVFESDTDSINQRVGKEPKPFSIIADPDRNLYKLYGVESSWWKFIKGGLPIMKSMLHGFFPGKMEGDKAIIPADFLINEEGIITHTHYGHHIGDHIPIRRIQKFIKNGNGEHREQL